MAAQAGSIQGTITLANTHDPLVAVNVYLNKTTIGTITNALGEYTLTDVPPGEYQLMVSAIGFGQKAIPVEVKNGNTVSVSTGLTETATDLPPIVVESITLTGGLNRAGKLPGSGVYISPKELQQFQYTDINRTLRQVPGVYVQEEDGFGLRVNVGLRGTGSERSSKITIMEDGILMAPAPYAAPAAYYFPTIGRMHAVEVLKGSSQIRFGPYTTGGALNLISTPIPSQFSGQISLLGGTYGSRNVNASVGNQHKNVAYMGQAFLYGSEGFKELDNGGNTGLNREDYLAKVRFNTKADAAVYQSLTLKAGWANETSNETYLGLTDADFEVAPLRRYAASQMDQMNTDHRQLSATYSSAATFR
jgi:Fe(3+) dicitrate transport protein